jgi:hypothetical protein
VKADFVAGDSRHAPTLASRAHPTEMDPASSGDPQEGFRRMVGSAGADLIPRLQPLFRSHGLLFISETPWVNHVRQFYIKAAALPTRTKFRIGGQCPAALYEVAST